MIGAEKLSGLHPHFRPAIEFLIQYAEQQGVRITLVSGKRSNAEQARAAAQAKAAGRPAALPGRSAHNYGLAIDMFAGASSRSPEHKWLMRVARAMGFKFYPKDDPHFEHPQWPQLRQQLR
jgi:LAS superfamily LD-carboxypeptidase LdcB